MAQENTPVERACDRCRERRVKCDKRRPTCLRCEKLGKPCPGYDKKRKFVDEGESLRRKYHATASNDESGLKSPEKRPESVLSGAGRSPAELVSPTNRLSHHDLPERSHQRDESASNTTRSPRDKPAWSVPNFDVVSMLNPVEESAAHVPDQPLPDFDADKAFFDILNDPSLDPAWFNLDPSEYYGAAGNSCGFLSDVPNIIDEVDRDDFMQSIEENSHRRSNSESGLQSTTWAPQLHTSAIIVDEREHEMAYLIRHFTEAIGPWMDLFDQEEHFGSLVPLKALRDALLRNAIAAVSAKQLGRVKRAKPHVDNQVQKPAMMEVIEEVDWFYKAANYYDKAIAFSRLYLQAISNTYVNPPSPNTQQQVAAANSDDLLVAVSIFSLYEWLDNLDLDWLQHLSGLKTLLSTLKDNHESDTQFSPSITVGRRASLWNFTRADYHAAYLNRQHTLLDTEDLQLWHSCGLQIQADGSLYYSPSKVKQDPLHCRPITELVAHTMLWLVLRVMNYIASDIHSTSRETHWLELARQLDAWHRDLPQTFQPCAQIRYPIKSTRTATQHLQQQSQLVEVFFSMNVCAAALQLYHFARIILLLNKPRPSNSNPAGSFSSDQDRLDALKHAHQIIGIALGRPHPAVRVEMLLPLYVAGTCLEAREERNVVLELLRAIEKDTGCATESRCVELMNEWKWSEVDVLMA